MKQSRTVRFDTDKEEDAKAFEILKSLKEGRGNQFIIEAIIRYNKQTCYLTAEDVRSIIREELAAAGINKENKGISAETKKEEPQNKVCDESLNAAMDFINSL